MVASDPPNSAPREGDELWFGLTRIRVSDEMTPERQRWIEAGRVAQAAHSSADLSRLIESHPDYRVRYEAIPRLRARFPNDPETLDVLAVASRNSEAAVRDAAVMALQWMPQAAAADYIAARLTDASSTCA